MIADEESIHRPTYEWGAAASTRTRLAKVGPFAAGLVNGVFGDPLLLVRLLYSRRCLLFDLGDASKLRTRIAHQVTDVFVTHAHVDHIAGFFWLLRARIGEFPPCRLYGPPGFARNIAALVAGVHWDRAGRRAPRFVVTECHAERLERYEIVTHNEGAEHVATVAATEGLVLEEPALRVRAVLLDHGTPVVAYALEPRVEIHVRRERLAALGLQPGAWLTALKRAVAERSPSSSICLPDGTTRSSEELADELFLVRPGPKLVYATDLADTPTNRTRLVSLAAGAHTLFCEATFCEADASRAASTGHLTARACGEIAAAAGVHHLVPFHFSRRYEDERERVYREVQAALSPAHEDVLRAAKPSP